MIERRRVEIGIVVMVLLVALPGALLGVGFLREDWYDIARLRHCGFIECPGPEIVNRPVMSLLWNVPFGWFDNHPAVIYWILNMMLSVTGVALYVALRTYLSQVHSFLVVAIWAVVPTHMTLQHWASVMHNCLSLMLFTLGIALLLRRPGKLAVALLVLSALVYESTVPLSIVALLLAPRFSLGELSRRFAFTSAALLVLVTATIVVLQLGSRDSDYLNPMEVYWANFTMGSTHWFALVLAGATTIGALIGVSRVLLSSTRPRAGEPEWSIVVGAVVMFLGALPFASSDFDTMFTGLGDRANQTASIGAAMIWLGVLRLARWRWALPAGLIALLALAVPLRVEREQDYAYVTTTTPKLLTNSAPSPDETRYKKLSTSVEQERRLASQARPRP